MSLATPQTIAVIGAGLAGLSCAQALLKAGHTVHVFDKSRAPSGRMSTRRAEDDNGPWQCDHGAQYFTARDPAFRAEVARWQQAGVAALWNARLASFDGNAWSTPATPLERFVGTPRMTTPQPGWCSTWASLRWRSGKPPCSGWTIARAGGPSPRQNMARTARVTAQCCWPCPPRRPCPCWPQRPPQEIGRAHV